MSNLKSRSRSEFERTWNRNKKMHNIFFAIFVIAWAISLSAIIALIFYVGGATINLLGDVQHVGLKTVVESIWCGSGLKCL